MMTPRNQRAASVVPESAHAGSFVEALAAQDFAEPSAVTRWPGRTATVWSCAAWSRSRSFWVPAGAAG